MAYTVRVSARRVARSLRHALSASHCLLTDWGGRPPDFVTGSFVTACRGRHTAGVEAQFEAIQTTETPLEFLLRKMRDIRHRGVLSQLVVALSQLAERNGLGHYFPSNPLLRRKAIVLI